MRVNQPPRTHVVSIATLMGLGAACWFIFLSGWLGVVPGSVLVKRQNVLFNSDTNVWIEEMIHNHAPSASWRVAHPMEVVLWRPPIRALAFMLRAVLPDERAGLLATRIVLALVAGAGVGCLALVALDQGLALSQCLLVFAMYLLFTSSSTIVLPEHFGISNGLLSVAFAAPILIASRARRVGILGTLAVLCGGTTLTNVLYPLAGLYQFGFRSRARRRIVIAIAAGFAIAVFLFLDSRQVVLNYTDADKDIASRVAIVPKRVPGVTRWYLKTTGLHIHVSDYLNLRLVHSPGHAVIYAIHAVVSPAVGPAPPVRRANGLDMVTYESNQPLRWDPNGYFIGSDGFDLRDYKGIQAGGAIIWIVLLVTCSYSALRDPQVRSFVWLPLGWILFNIVFHNIWGDELFLYAPHWSWALMALVILGVRYWSPTRMATMIIPIMICQVDSLIRIKSALASIIR
jgi:hypothetical protein